MPAKMYLDPMVYVPMPLNEAYEKRWAEHSVVEQTVIPTTNGPLVFETRVDESGIQYGLIRRLGEYETVL